MIAFPTFPSDFLIYPYRGRQFPHFKAGDIRAEESLKISYISTNIVMYKNREALGYYVFYFYSIRYFYVPI